MVSALHVPPERLEERSLRLFFFILYAMCVCVESERTGLVWCFGIAKGEVG